MDIREKSDAGLPVVATDPDGPHAEVYRGIAGREHIRRNFLITRHLGDYLALLCDPQQFIRLIEDGAKADLKRWMQSVDVTAARAGLLLCADLEIAKKIIAAEPQLPADLSPPEKLKELIVFSVSEQYLALRKALGIAIG